MNFDKQVIFYDGDCGFCNKSVQFVLKHLKVNDVYFTSLQSKYSNDFFVENNYPAPDLSTFYYTTKGKLYSKSDAALRIIPTLKWYLQWLRIGWLVPKFLRDKLYDAVAKRRDKLSPGYCAIPSPEERKRFLD